jgi:toxin-antitoxin system PIN domain toxin
VSVLVDTNILLYASLPEVPEHERARAWLMSTLGDPDATVGLCWPVLFSLTRLLSSRTIMGEAAISVPRAWGVAEAIRSQPGARMVSEGPRHADLVATLATTPGLTARDVPDLQLAALAIENGLAVATHDRGFARFTQLRWLDPITGESSTASPR